MEIALVHEPQIIIQDTPAEEVVESDLVQEPTSSNQSIQLTEAELWKYRYLSQLAINARMRADMYALEVGRAKKDLVSADNEYKSFISTISSKYKVNFAKCVLEPDGTLRIIGAA